jgi:hypothetical protein
MTKPNSYQGPIDHQPGAGSCYSPSYIEAVLIREGRIALDANGNWIKPDVAVQHATVEVTK